MLSPIQNIGKNVVQQEENSKQQQVTPQVVDTGNDTSKINTSLKEIKQQQLEAQHISTGIDSSSNTPIPIILVKILQV